MVEAKHKKIIWWLLGLCIVVSGTMYQIPRYEWYSGMHCEVYITRDSDTDVAVLLDYLQQDCPEFGRDSLFLSWGVHQRDRTSPAEVAYRCFRIYDGTDSVWARFRIIPTGFKTHTAIVLEGIYSHPADRKGFIPLFSNKLGYSRSNQIRKAFERQILEKYPKLEWRNDDGYLIFRRFFGPLWPSKTVLI